jgi:hypothetical protein
MKIAKTMIELAEVKKRASETAEKRGTAYSKRLRIEQADFREDARRHDDCTANTP